MGKFWHIAASWVEGKKTIAGGVAIMAASIAGVWFGRLDPVTALGVFGTGLSIAGFADKANRHQSELLTALQGISQVAVDVKAGNTAQAVKVGEQTALSLGTEFAPASGGTIAEVSTVAESLLSNVGGAAK